MVNLGGYHAESALSNLPDLTESVLFPVYSSRVGRVSTTIIPILPHKKSFQLWTHFPYSRGEGPPSVCDFPCLVQFWPCNPVKLGTQLSSGLQGSEVCAKPVVTCQIFLRPDRLLFFHRILDPFLDSRYTLVQGPETPCIYRWLSTHLSGQTFHPNSTLRHPTAY